MQGAFILSIEFWENDRRGTVRGCSDRFFRPQLSQTFGVLVFVVLAFYDFGGEFSRMP